MKDIEKEVNKHKNEVEKERYASQRLQDEVDT